MIISSRFKIISLLFTSLMFLSCLKNDELNLEFETYAPIDLGDGLVISTPDAENMDGSKLSQIYRDVYTDENLWSLRSLLVFRNGKLVAESYLKDPNDIHQRYLIWSATKQIVAVLIGIAIEDGIIEDLDDPISDYLGDELSNYPDKKDITIRNLLTMQSGIAFNNEGLNGESDKLLREIPDNSLAFILGLPMRPESDLLFNYNDGDPHILSALIQKKVGKPMDEWANEVLFSKIGFSNYNWVRYRDGITLGGFGIETTPRELAKIALCVSDSGKWQGYQIVNMDWVNEMTSPQVDTENNALSFGYYWWLDENRNVYFMDGHGGQYAFVVPNKNVVVVMTAIPNTQGDFQIKSDEAFVVLDQIIEAAY